MLPQRKKLGRLSSSQNGRNSSETSTNVKIDLQELREPATGHCPWLCAGSKLPHKAKAATLWPCCTANYPQIYCLLFALFQNFSQLFAQLHHPCTILATILYIRLAFTVSAWSSARGAQRHTHPKSFVLSPNMFLVASSCYRWNDYQWNVSQGSFLLLVVSKTY